jgi:hypothetical protein
MEDANSARSDEKSDNDQDNAPEHLLANDSENAADHEDDRNDPQDGSHG